MNDLDVCGQSDCRWDVNLGEKQFEGVTQGLVFNCPKQLVATNNPPSQHLVELFTGVSTSELLHELNRWSIRKRKAGGNVLLQIPG